ncbi:MAG: ATP-dependent DNA helicase RecG [Clostridia bacterium]|nr:ATP-dependent DNA helicase RecG [Clostridia bacterium]
MAYGIPLPKLSAMDLKSDAIDLFKQKGVSRGRLSEEDTNVNNDILMENLHLIDEDGYLTRAAMLAFHRDPERWVTGAYIKIGFFGNSDSDLQYQDEIHGPLIEQIDRTIDLVYTKYMKDRITYEGIQRVEVFMFPQEAFREILLNAVVHKDYASCNPIQISIYEDHMYIWNDGEMPSNLRTTENLFAKHSSKPFNPKLAHVFFISGMIEAWGRGFDKIKAACNALYETPMPDYDITDNGIMVRCNANDLYLQLMNENRLGIDESILRRFRDDERHAVMTILDMVSVAEFISSSQIRERLGRLKASVARLLSKMCDEGLLQTVGAGRATKYQKTAHFS